MEKITLAGWKLAWNNTANTATSNPMKIRKVVLEEVFVDFSFTNSRGARSSVSRRGNVANHGPKNKAQI